MLRELAEQHQHEAEKDDALDMIRALSRATQRMTQVVVAMLDVTHVDIESIDLVFTPVEIKEVVACAVETFASAFVERKQQRSEEHTSELQSRENLVCRLLL